MPRRSCTVCGSRQWHKEPTSGLVTCSEGHVLQNYRTEARVMDEFGPHAMNKRTLKFGRKRKERPSRADPQLYHGDRARYHYFQCLQLILRHQVNSIVNLWNLPMEFETLCRDFWALHLSLLPTPLPAEPLLHYQEQGRDEDQNLPTEAEDENRSDNSETSDDETDPEMDALLRELSEASSSEGEGIDLDPAPMKNIQKRKRRGTYDFPANNIAILMLACWTLRIPVLYMDFIRCIEAYDLPYLDALSLIPTDMRRHLTKQNVHALSPHFSPSTASLHALASRLAKRVYSTYGIYTPELNAAPMLWRAVRCLQGTATLYKMSKKLAAALSLPLTLHYSLAPQLKVVKAKDPERHKYDNLPPEVALVATVVVVLRLVYGLDGKERCPRNPEDPACAFPILQEYLEQLKQAHDAEFNDNRNIFSAKDNVPIQEVDEGTLDRYLEFCAKKALLSNQEQTPIVEEFFCPTVEESTRPAFDNNNTRQLAAIPLGQVKNGLVPGESYRIYHSHDLLGNVPEEYTLVVARAARWTGVEEEYLYAVIERFERRYLRWWKMKQKRDRTVDPNSDGDD